MHINNIIYTIFNYVMPYILKLEQDLGTLFMWYFLSFPFKILSCEFFIMRWKCIF